MKIDNKDNKYRKVLLMVQRAKQIRNGARPRLHMPGRRATCVAMAEVEQHLIGYDYVPVPKDKRY